MARTVVIVKIEMEQVESEEKLTDTNPKPCLVLKQSDQQESRASLSRLSLST